jgi:hypothetical protein
MKNTAYIFAMLLGVTFLFHGALNYMVDNIGDYETVALPPKKVESVSNPTIKVDASSRDDWALVDFASGETHRIQDPEKKIDQLNKIKWDLGFQRTKIISNSGETNPNGKVGSINLGKVDINKIEEAPDAGYKQDIRSWGKLSNPALSDWYLYRTRTHNVESQRNVYVVRTAGNLYMKMRILNYYCSHQEADCATTMCAREEAGCLTIEYLLQSDGGKIFQPVAEPALTPK